MINDFEIFHNHLLGAHSMWEFAKSYKEHELNKKPPVLILAMPLLPIVFNQRATECIKNKGYKEGSLYKVITENKDLYLGLQNRMEQTALTTFKSINTAIASGLILYDKETSQLIPNHKSSFDVTKKDYKEILQASKRIGAWFAQLNLQEIMTYFNLKF